MFKKLFATLIVLGIVGAAAFGLWVWDYAITPGPVLSDAAPRSAAVTEEGTVIIPAGSGLRSIRAILTEAEVIDDDIRFLLLGRILDISRHLKAGEYRFKSDMTPMQVLRQLEAGMTVRWPVTIPEGSNIYDVADILARGGWVEREDFVSLVRNQEFIGGLGLVVESLEGYLFPDTYYLVRGQQAGEIIRMMVGRLQQVMARLCDDFVSGFEADAHLACTAHLSRAMTFHELLTLASIVEKETGQAGERPLVASVFLNRLSQGMRLQADPTVVYGLLPQFAGRLTRNDLRAETPYNTYVVKGLPPTPIANPGRATLEAVLNPASASYLYFVSKNDGSHQFSSTLQEHNQAVDLYQRRKKTVKGGQ
jgi:UPF0755 protein